jgi:hypothetical protein
VFCFGHSICNLCRNECFEDCNERDRCASLQDVEREELLVDFSWEFDHPPGVHFSIFGLESLEFDGYHAYFLGKNCKKGGGGLGCIGGELFTLRREDAKNNSEHGNKDSPGSLGPLPDEEHVNHGGHEENEEILPVGFVEMCNGFPEVLLISLVRWKGISVMEETCKTYTVLTQS